MSIISFRMLKIDNVKSPKMMLERGIVNHVGKICIIIVSMINKTERTNTKVSLFIKIVQKFLYLMRAFTSDSFCEMSPSMRFDSFSGTMKITPSVIAKKMLIMVRMSLIKF